ncbi:hypothetical protein WI85_16275 [Burkholderia ubonensis]|nr:hypothetical protein WI85_16275 [Burkholderia ubonensis]
MNELLQCLFGFCVLADLFVNLGAQLMNFIASLTREPLITSFHYLQLFKGKVILVAVEIEACYVKIT